MKKQYKEQSILFPVLRCGIQIFWTKKFEDNSIAYTTTFNDEGSTNPQVYFNTNLKVPIGTISHELLHAVRDILYNRGFDKLGEPSDECLTYHHTYSLVECIKFAKKHKIKLCDSVGDM